MDAPAVQEISTDDAAAADASRRYVLAADAPYLANMAALWGIDLGGTKIEGVVLPSIAGDAPTPLARLRIPTEQEGGYQAASAQYDPLLVVVGIAQRPPP